MPFCLYTAGENMDENMDMEEMGENVFEEENVNEENVVEEDANQEDVAEEIDQPNNDSDSDISDEDNDFVDPNEAAYRDKIYPGVLAKKEIIDFWVLPNDRRRKFSVVQNRYRKIQSERQLRQWRKDLLEKGKR